MTLNIRLGVSARAHVRNTSICYGTSFTAACCLAPAVLSTATRASSRPPPKSHV
eukprot:COSAG05_NODE_1138_length_5750_cov_15.376747_1_plen_53_part_10